MRGTTGRDSKMEHLSAEVQNFNAKLIRSSMKEGPGSRPEPSWCRSEELFREVWTAFPKASVLFRLRNFNDLKDLTTVSLNIPGISHGDWIPGEGDRVYCHHVDLGRLDSAFVERFAGKHTANIREFVKEGPALATALGREVTILHQYGSGNQEDASYTTYGPYRP